MGLGLGFRVRVRVRVKCRVRVRDRVRDGSPTEGLEFESAAFASIFVNVA